MSKLISGGRAALLALGMGAVSLAVTSVFAGVPSERNEGARNGGGGLTLYLSDPELGLAGSYVLDGRTLYFEARRGDTDSGARGALSIRIIDLEARTLAVAGEPLDEDWVSGSVDIQSLKAMPAVLGGLAAELAKANLHPSVAGDQLALADLANHASAIPARMFPLMVERAVSVSTSADRGLIADFNAQAASRATPHRAADGALAVQFDNGFSFDTMQTFLLDEQDDEGRPGRIDVYSRIVDADGYTLNAELGGDHMPASWDDSLESENMRDWGQDERAMDLGAAASALNALSHGNSRLGRGAPHSNRMEAESMQRLARGMVEMLLPRRAGLSEVVGEGGMLMATGLYRTRLVLHKKPFVVIAEHSATRVYKDRFKSSSSSTYNVVSTLNYCNHGTCVGGAKMSRKCGSTGPRLGHYRVPSRRSDAGGHTCSTGYFATAHVPLRHNCHDDSSVQVRAVRGLSYSHNGGRCKDWVAWTHAPSCG